jgi:hypothetical protein
LPVSRRRKIEKRATLLIGEEMTLQELGGARERTHRRRPADQGKRDDLIPNSHHDAASKKFLDFAPVLFKGESLPPQPGQSFVTTTESLRKR